MSKQTFCHGQKGHYISIEFIYLSNFHLLTSSFGVVFTSRWPGYSLTRSVIMLSTTLHIYLEKYRKFWERSPLIHKKGFHVKVSLRNLTKAESGAWCFPKSDNRRRSCMTCSPSANYSQWTPVTCLHSPWGGNWCCCWSTETDTWLKPFRSERASVYTGLVQEESDTYTCMYMCRGKHVLVHGPLLNPLKNKTKWMLVCLNKLACDTLLSCPGCTPPHATHPV